MKASYSRRVRFNKLQVIVSRIIDDDTNDITDDRVRMVLCVYYVCCVLCVLCVSDVCLLTLSGALFLIVLTWHHH